MNNNSNYSFQIILARIAAIREEHDINERIRMLHELNNMLPAGKRIELPSLITNAYIRRALDVILEKAVTPAVSA